MTSTTERLRWPFVVALSLCAVFVVAYVLGPAVAHAIDRASDVSPPSAAQVRAANALAASLRPVAGSVDDRYDSACNAPTPYCITAQHLSARQLAVAIRTQLVNRGAARPGAVSCDTGGTDPLPLTADCTSAVTFHGVTMEIWAFDPRSYAGIRRPARAFVVVDAERTTTPDPPARPLPSWRGLELFPLAWGTPPCKAPTDGGGCRKYDGQLTLRMPLGTAIAAVKSRLLAWSLVIDAAQCGLDARHPGCIYSGMKFRTAGGHDLVTVGVVVHPGPGDATTLHVMVTNW